MNMWSDHYGGDALHPEFDEVAAEDLDALPRLERDLHPAVIDMCARRRCTAI